MAGSFRGLAAAKAVAAIARKPDLRLLMALVSALGLAAWLAPWPAPLLLLPLALPVAWAAWRLAAVPRGALAAYLAFVALWTAAQFLAGLSDGAPAPAAAAAAAHMGARLLAATGLALAAPLSATPLALGRAAAWFLGPLDRFWPGGGGGSEAPGGFWRAALAICLMASFLPRALESLRRLSQTMSLRRPRPPLALRARLIGEAALRILGSQAWEAALAVASRDLWRPGPWRWPKGGGGGGSAGQDGLGPARGRDPVRGGEEDRQPHRS